MHLAFLPHLAPFFIPPDRQFGNFPRSAVRLLVQESIRSPLWVVLATFASLGLARVIIDLDVLRPLAFENIISHNTVQPFPTSCVQG